MIGSFELLVRAYPNGALSQRLATMEIDEAMAFKHIRSNVEARRPFSAKKVGMLAGGTGITPVQALRCSVHRTMRPKSLVYGSKTPPVY